MTGTSATPAPVSDWLIMSLMAHAYNEGLLGPFSHGTPAVWYERKAGFSAWAVGARGEAELHCAHNRQGIARPYATSSVDSGRVGRANHESPNASLISQHTRLGKLLAARTSAVLLSSLLVMADLNCIMVGGLARSACYLCDIIPRSPSGV